MHGVDQEIQENLFDLGSASRERGAGSGLVDDLNRFLSELVIQKLKRVFDDFRKIGFRARSAGFGEGLQIAHDDGCPLARPE